MEFEEIILNYKHKIASKYLPVRSDQICKRVFEMDKYYVSTKIDGNICFINKGVDEVSIVSHNNNSFKRPDLEKKCLEILKDKTGLFIGEIYLHDDNKRTRSYDLKREISDESSDIRIALFDVLKFNNIDFKENEWSKKKKILEENFKSDGKIYYLNEFELSSRKEIEEYFIKNIIDSSQEGLVVRGENGPIFKIKEYHSFDMVVLGYVNGYSNDFSLLKEILVGVMTEEKYFLCTGIIANGFDVELRKNLSKDFEKIKIELDSLIVSNSKLPFTMIEPKYVVEIESTDIINSTSKGFINRPLIEFNKKYTFQKNSNSISLTTPVFIKFRQDKNVNYNDIGLNQITRVIEIPSESDDSLNQSQPEILNKAVYTKIMKGCTNVKKFFVWHTKSINEMYPKYVYYKIDYSPTRKDKMKRDIKISSSKKQILDIYNSEIDTDIKSGWNLSS